MSPDGQPDQALAQLIAGLLACCLTPLHLAASIWICFIMQGALKRVPAQYRKIDPAMPWLRMVAFVPAAGALTLLIINFFILPPTSRSIAAAAAARGETTTDDEGTRMALITCWLDVVAAIVAIIGGGLMLLAAISARAQGMTLRAMQSGDLESINPALLLAGLGALGLASLLCLISLIVFCVWLVKVNASGRPASATSPAASSG